MKWPRLQQSAMAFYPGSMFMPMCDTKWSLLGSSKKVELFHHPFLHFRLLYHMTSEVPTQLKMVNIVFNNFSQD